MTKRKIVPLLLLITLLAGCDNRETGSTGSDAPRSETPGTDPITVPISDTTEKKEYTVDDFYEYFEKLQNGNFTVDYSADAWETTYQDIYTENYIFYGLNDLGYVLLDAYGEKAGSEKVAYGLYYMEDENDYNIGTPGYYYDNKSVERIGTSMDDFNYFTYFRTYPESYWFEKDGIKQDGENFLVTSYYAEMMFSQALHIASYFYYGQVARLSFSFDDKGDLNLKVQGKVDEIRYANIIEAKFSRVGTTSDLFIEKYFKDGYILPSEKPTEKETEILFSDSIRLKGRMTSYNPDATPAMVDIGSIDNVFGTKNIYRSIINQAGNDFLYLNLYEKDGKTYEKSLDAQNKVSDKESTLRIKDFKTIRDVMDPDAIRKIGDNLYRYYGTNLLEVLDTCFGIENSYQQLGYISGITLEKHDDVIDTMHLYYGNYFYPGDTDYVDVALTLSNEGTAPELKPISNPDNTAVKAALDYFNGSHSYKMVAVTDLTDSLYASNPSTYSELIYDKDKKATYIKKYSAGKLIKEYGYLDAEDGMVSFEKAYKDDGTAYLRETAPKNKVQGAFRNTALFHVEGDTLVKKSEYNNIITYYFQGRVGGFGAIGFADSGIGESKNAVWNSPLFTFEGTAEEMRLATLKYNYQPNGANASTMQLTFTEDDALKIEENLTAIETYKEPTSWKEENLDFYEKLVELFQDNAEMIPYLYDKDLHDNFKFRYKGSDISFYSRVEGKEDYLTRYEAALKSVGFTKKDGEVKVYTKDNIQVTIQATLKEGITFRKI